MTDQTDKQGPQRMLSAVLGELAPGDVMGHGNLTVVPLRGEGRPGTDCMLAAEAMEAGLLTVTEVCEEGDVPELLAANGAGVAVLLLEGEELRGAKQNRVLNTSVLLPPESRTRIAVSCVEQGRWRESSPEMILGESCPSKLRARKTRGVTASLRRTGRADSDQVDVWNGVAETLVALQTHSPTQSLSDGLARRRRSLDAYLDALPYPPAARGVVAAIDGRFIAADVFSQPELLAGAWRRLVAGYALDALSAGSKSGRTFSAKGAEVLLAHVRRLACEVHPSVGIGEDWRFEADDLLGQALVVEGTCLHLAAFPADREEPSGGEGRIQAPSRRGRRRGRGAGDA